jgi:hypothetical protein
MELAHIKFGMVHELKPKSEVQVVATVVILSSTILRTILQFFLNRVRTASPILMSNNDDDSLEAVDNVLRTAHRWGEIVRMRALRAGETTLDNPLDALPAPAIPPHYPAVICCLHQVLHLVT